MYIRVALGCRLRSHTGWTKKGFFNVVFFLQCAWHGHAGEDCAGSHFRVQGVGFVS